MNVAPILHRNSLQLGTKANSTTLRTALLHWCCSSRNFEATPTVSAGNGTGADVENRTQDDFLKKGKEKGKGKHPNQRGVRTQHENINTCKNCSRTGQWAKDCWIPGGGACDITATVTTIIHTKAVHRCIHSRYMIFWFFRGGGGSVGRGEGEEKERETETETDTEPRYTTSHTTHAHLPFLPASVVFLVIPGNIHVHTFLCKCVCVCVHSLILRV